MMKTNPETARHDLIVVGAGPAGLSAALTAARYGLKVVVVDEQHDAGGQVFRQSPRSFEARPNAALRTYPFGAELLAQARNAPGIEWRFGSVAWGVFHGADDGRVKLAVSGDEQSCLFEGRHLLVATGAYDLPVAFPGWTLPGVMSAGGAQTFIKSQHLRPGKRYVLAGSHPLLLVLAEQLLDAGAEVLEVAIARPRPGFGELLSHLKALSGHAGLIGQLGKTLARLRAAGVPLRFGTMVSRAEGTDTLQQVVLTDVDADWTPIAGTERTLRADSLAIGYGLLASTELARQAGCEVRWAPAEGGWIVRHDARMRTNVKGVLVAGEPAGVGGAELAHLQGRLAGLTAVDEVIGGAMPAVGHEAAHEAVALERAATEASIRAARGFTDSVVRFFAPRLDALANLAAGDTLVCRCEEVTADTVRGFIADNEHVSDVNSVKLACRTGMGFCQGRYCQHTTAHLLAQARGRDVSELGVFRAQVPVKPVPLASIAALKLPD